MTSPANLDHSEGILSGVIEILSGIGNVSGLSPDQDFYDAGITSVMSLPIILEVEDRYNISVPDELFIKCRTARELAKVIADVARA
ncbi:MAG: hypothetical protein C5B58_14640 [Acidobacteria bacterium]|nr:MAG: hypothetical protein C5B58_14640 [Acidobacteriota bacterium]